MTQYGKALLAFQTSNEFKQWSDPSTLGSDPKVQRVLIENRLIEVATGTIERSGIKFRLFVSEPVDADDLRAIGNLLHGGAIKVEETLDAQPQEPKHD